MYACLINLLLIARFDYDLVCSQINFVILIWCQKRNMDDLKPTNYRPRSFAAHAGPDLDLWGPLDRLSCGAPRYHENFIFYWSDHEFRSKWTLGMWGPGQRHSPGSPCSLKFVCLVIVVSLFKQFLTRLVGFVGVWQKKNCTELRSWKNNYLSERSERAPVYIFRSQKVTFFNELYHTVAISTFILSFSLFIYYRN